MKKLFIALLAVAAVVSTASAQTYSAQSLSVPATLGNGVTNLASPPTIGALKQQNVALSVTISGTAGGTNTITLNKSVDGSNWDTNSANCITFVAGTTSGQNVTTTTNLTVSGFGYLRIQTMNVTSSGTITNNSVTYGIKLNAP